MGSCFDGSVLPASFTRLGTASQRLPPPKIAAVALLKQEYLNSKPAASKSSPNSVFNFLQEQKKRTGCRESDQ